MARHLRSILPALVVMLAWTALAQACPLCKDAIPNSDAQSSGGLPNGFNMSIFSMLGGLFAVVGVFGTYVVRTIRQTDRASARRGFDITPDDRRDPRA